MFQICHERPSDVADIETLLDTTFGPDRFDKASYRVREDECPLNHLSFIALSDARLIGTIRFWPIVIRDLILGDQIEAVLLGPLAVDCAWQGRGVGAKLVRHGLSCCEMTGHNRVLLVGDDAYYGQFGFQPVVPSFITLPGGKDARRLLVRQPASMPSLPAVGRIEAYKQHKVSDYSAEVALAV